MSLKRTRRDNATKIVSYVSKNSNRNIRSDIHSRSDKNKSSNAIQNIFRPKVEYQLGQTFLIDKQVKKIESDSLLPKIMAKCGYKRNTTLSIRGGSKELCGAEFYSFLNIF